MACSGSGGEALDPSERHMEEMGAAFKFGEQARQMD
jgi:hypothetical protein